MMLTSACVRVCDPKSSDVTATHVYKCQNVTWLFFCTLLGYVFYALLGYAQG